MLSSLLISDEDHKRLLDNEPVFINIRSDDVVHPGTTLVVTSVNGALLKVKVDKVVNLVRNGKRYHSESGFVTFLNTGFDEEAFARILCISKIGSVGEMGEIQSNIGWKGHLERLARIVNLPSTDYATPPCRFNGRELDEDDFCALSLVDQRAMLKLFGNDIFNRMKKVLGPIAELNIYERDIHRIDS